MVRYDILIDENGNPMISGGDFVIGPSLQQEAEAIIGANQGEYKHYPLVGCNLIRFKNSSVTNADVMRTIRRQLEADGINFRSINNIINATQ